MGANSNAFRIGVWGASGSGKSSYVKQRLKDHKRLIVFDPLDEYGPLCNVTVHSLDDVRKYIIPNYRSFKIAYVPPAGKEAAALSRLSKLAMKAQEGFKASGKGMDLTMIVEEMNLSFPVHGGAAKCPGFAEVCSRGRHYGLNVYGLSQRLAEVETRFRGNCTKSIILRQQGPNDVKAAMDVSGVDKTAITNLKNLEFLEVDSGEVKKSKISQKK